MDNYFPSLNKFLTSKIGAFFILLPFVKPAAELTGDFDVIFDVWKLVASALILIGCVWTLHKANRIVYWIMGLQLVMLLSTIINKADFKAAIVQVLSVISICIYFDYFMRVDSYNAISSIMLPLVSMSILTAISMFVFYPNGMYVVGDESVGDVIRQNYLWGFDNASIFNFIPGMYLLGLYALNNNIKKQIKIWTVILFLFISLAFLYVFSITAFIGCFAITFVFMFLILYKKKIHVFTTRNLVILIVALTLILFISKDNLHLLMDFASKTDKSMSIKTRFVIWDLVIKLWEKSPIIGYGIEDHNILVEKLSIDHPHNYFMDVLYRAGILGIFSVVGVFYNLIKGKWADTHINAFSAIVIFVLLLIAQLDFYNDHYLFYPVMIVLIHSKSIVDERANSFNESGIAIEQT